MSLSKPAMASQPKDKRSSRNALRSYLGAYGFMAPAGILVIIFFLIPVAIVLYLSVTNLASSNFTSNLAAMEFIGLKNYRTLLNDQFARKIFFNTIFYVLVTLSFFNVGLALIVSLLTTHIDRNAGFFFPRIVDPATDHLARGLYLDLEADDGGSAFRDHQSVQ